MKKLGNPLKKSFELNNPLNYFNGNFYFGAGLYDLPVTRFNYTKPFKNGIFEGFANGNYQRAYVRNSDRYSLSGGANLSYFISNDASFLSGTQFKLHSKYGFSSYKFFASNTPQAKRTLGLGDLSLSVNNIRSKNFLFASKLSDNYYSISQESFAENFVQVYGMMKLAFTTFNIGTDINYKLQSLKNIIGNNLNYNFLKMHPQIGVNIGKNIKAEFGFLYAEAGTNNFLAPTASIAFRVNKDISFFGEYSPDVDFYGSGYFLTENRYFNTQNFKNLFFSKPTNLKITIKYEYQTFFEIDAGLQIFSSKYIPYFTSSLQSGKFDVVTTSGRSGDAFVNFLFYFGPYGSLFSTAEFYDSRDTSGNILPYYPRGRISLNYSYAFKNGLTTEVKLAYNSGSYTNISNTNKLNPFINLGLNFIYKLKHNFDLTLRFSNLLNHNNYIWMGYKEIPFNAVAGFRYHW